uniref:Uncharacterized protein n=1 Tax=Kryptoperidinium triquetrum TaxID=66468 RepID=Q5ENI5_KRYTR|nr:unknown protein [Heterocapsa triquetra]
MRRCGLLPPLRVALSTARRASAAMQQLHGRRAAVGVAVATETQRKRALIEVWARCMCEHIRACRPHFFFAACKTLR